MKKRSFITLIGAVVLLLGLSIPMMQCAPSDGEVTPPDEETCMDLDLEMSKAPKLNEIAELTCIVGSLWDLPNTTVEITLPEGATLISGDLTWQGDLKADNPVSLSATIRFTETGNWAIKTVAKSIIDEDNSCSDIAYIRLNVGATKGTDGFVYPPGEEAKAKAVQSSPGDGQPVPESIVEKLTLDELTVKADSILVAKVTDIACYQEGEGRIYTLITLEVEQTIKGAVQEKAMIKVPGGEVDGLGLWVEDVPEFQLGERAVVFLEESGGIFSVVGGFQGKFGIDKNNMVSGDMPLSVFIDQIRGYPGKAIKETEMENLWLVLHWGSPIGIGIFLVCLGGMIYLLSKADEISKRTKAMAKEKELQKKKD